MYRLNTILLVIFILTSCSEKEKKSFCLEGCDCANSKTVPPGTWGDKMNTKYTYEKSSLTAQGFIQVYDSTSLTLVCIDGTNKIKSFKYERYQSGLNRTIISSIISYEDSSNVIYADTVISIPLGEFSCRRIVSTGVALKASVGNYAQTYFDTVYYSTGGDGIIRSSSWVFEGSNRYISAEFVTLSKIED